MDKPDIYKVAGILVRDRRTLIVRSHKDTGFMTPGGKPESGETELDTLRRELNEELAIVANVDTVEKLGTFTQEAFNKPGKFVQIDAYLVTDHAGEPAASNEIAEIRWITSEEAKDIELAHVFAHEIIPILVKKGLID